MQTHDTFIIYLSQTHLLGSNYVLDCLMGTSNEQMNKIQYKLTDNYLKK